MMDSYSQGLRRKPTFYSDTETTYRKKKFEKRKELFQTGIEPNKNKALAVNIFYFERCG